MRHELRQLRYDLDQIILGDRRLFLLGLLPLILTVVIVTVDAITIAGADVIVVLALGEAAIAPAEQ